MPCWTEWSKLAALHPVGFSHSVWHCLLEKGDRAPSGSGASICSSVCVCLGVGYGLRLKFATSRLMNHSVCITNSTFSPSTHLITYKPSINIENVSSNVQEWYMPTPIKLCALASLTS